MRKSRATATDRQTLRDALASLPPGSAHQANDPPSPEEIYTPRSHANALDPQRALVFGNRGVGKSFWSSVLTHNDTRARAAAAYPRLPLARIRAKLGYHEAAGKDDGPAPSQATLARLHTSGHEPEAIWRGVLVNALRDELVEPIPPTLDGILSWLAQDIERGEAALRSADAAFQKRNEIFLLIFDALDRLGKTWNAITPLTEGILRLALDMRGFRAMKAKVFMRTDQSKDDSLFRFADASKIRSDAVQLVWRRGELFGLLYNSLLKTRPVEEALLRLAGEDADSEVSRSLLSDEEIQEALFYRLAGEFMGAGPKRGRTYTWLYDHLADTFGETSPRSFITAISRAAEFTPPPKETSIDYNGIRAGVQTASKVRVDQLKEDYDWIKTVLDALSGLEVPCDPAQFIGRWRERGTVEQLREEAGRETWRLPLELATKPDEGEEALLNALRYIGVVEFRTESRINMPDIFRVEAGIKRRGGVRPPTSRNG